MREYFRPMLTQALAIVITMVQSPLRLTKGKIEFVVQDYINRLPRDIRGIYALFDPAVLWKWVDEDKEERAELAARFVPPFLFHAKGKLCYARELLVRYGDREEVRNSFAASFGSEGWTGPESLHHLQTIAELEEFNKNETDPRVKSWVEKYIRHTQKYVERARIEEEREGR